MEIRDKITIRDKESAQIPSKDLVATLKWRSSVDLDLYGIYKDKRGYKGKIYFGDRGSLSTAPFISLDKDAGVGDRGGDNEENMRFADISDLEHVLIVANIFNKSNAVFSSYDGSVTVKSRDQEVIVPLTSKAKGNWCIIAHMDNTGATPKLININETLSEIPTISGFLGENGTSSWFSRFIKTIKDLLGL